VSSPSPKKEKNIFESQYPRVQKDAAAETEKDQISSDEVLTTKYIQEMYKTITSEQDRW
jgi:hypothetical protein